MNKVYSVYKTIKTDHTPEEYIIRLNVTIRLLKDDFAKNQTNYCKRATKIQKDIDKFSGILEQVKKDIQ